MQFIGTGDRILTENFNVGYLYTITFKTGIYINSACIGIGDTFVMFQKAEPDLLFTLNVDTADDVDTIELYDTGGGTNDYDDLVNRPQINSQTLTGNMSASDLGLQDTISDLDTIRAGAAAGATALQPAALDDYQTKIDSSHKLDSDLVDDTNSTNKFATAAQLSQIETNKNNISYNTAMGVKNVAPLKSSVNTGIANITFTQNADKSYTLAISATTSAALAFDISDTFTLDSSIQYVLSGNPSSGAIRLVLAEGTSPFSWIEQQYADNPVTITPVADKVYKLSLFIYANTAAITLTIKPMICPKSLYDSDSGYQPYAMSNADLTAAIQAIQARLAGQ